MTVICIIWKVVYCMVSNNDINCVPLFRMHTTRYRNRINQIKLFLFLTSDLDIDFDLDDLSFAYNFQQFSLFTFYSQLLLF